MNVAEINKILQSAMELIRYLSNGQRIHYARCESHMVRKDFHGKKCRLAFPMVLVRLAAVLTATSFMSGQLAWAQSNSDLIASFQGENVVAGNWQRADRELSVDAQRGARVMLCDATPESYSLTIEFTRMAGTNSVGVVLPVGGSQCAFILSAFAGEAHGIGVIDGNLARANQTTIKPGELENDHPYRLLIEVECKEESATVTSTLDGRPFLQWRGNPKSLSMLDFWKIPKASALGLVTYAETKFHRIQLSPLDPTMRMTKFTATNNVAPEPAKSESIEFGEQRWSAPNCESVAVENYLGKECLHIVGKERNFVFLPNTGDFQDGTIEVDIASKTFSGIGFRGNREGSLTEKVYFRPFNSGTEKHSNSVQYSMLGREEFGWRALRESKPGKYETGAELPMDQWFHVKVVVKGNRMEAYVDDAPKPVLVVQPLLSDRTSGVIGVWGWDSRFANFKFTPAQ